MNQNSFYRQHLSRVYYPLPIVSHGLVATALIAVVTCSTHHTHASEIYRMDGGWVQDVSADGSAAVGWFDRSGTISTGIWDPTTGVISWLPANASEASGISSDGLVVGGYSLGEDGDYGSRQAYRWTEETGMQLLGRPADGFSVVNLVTPNGSEIYGSSEDLNGGECCTRWRWTEDLGIVTTDFGVPDFVPAATSTDGSVLAGSVFPGSAYRWTGNTGAVPIESELPDRPRLIVFDMTPDGSVIAGYARPEDGGTPAEAFRWSQETGMVGLGFLPGYESSGNPRLSFDGSLIVGDVRNEGSDRALFVWTEPTGIVSLTEIIQAETGEELRGQVWLRSISRDGRTLVGNINNGPNQDFAWAVVLDQPLQHYLAIPEPGSMTLALALIAPLTVQRRRRYTN